MRYATVAEDGRYTGFYSKEVHGDNIPTPNVELTDEQWEQATSGNQKTGRWKWINGQHTFVLHTQEQLDKAELSRVRTERDSLLIRSDWTQIPNNPLTAEKQAEWAEYRQKLRDITKVKPYTFPEPPK